MNTEKNNKFITLLEEEKQSLEHAMSMLGVRNPDTGEWQAQPDMSDGQETDENDLADRAEDFEERTATLLTLEARLREVNTAFGKVKNETYGICDTCNGEIEEERLMANPASTTCIEHMSE